MGEREDGRSGEGIAAGAGLTETTMLPSELMAPQEP